MKLSDQIKTKLSDLIEQYNLFLVNISDAECLLISEHYCLHFSAELRNFSVNCIYFDRRGNDCISGYNLILFLIHKRRDRLKFLDKEPEYTNFQNYVDTQIETIAGHLKSGAIDILMGSKSWLTEYKWPHITPSPELSAIFKQQLTT